MATSKTMATVNHSHIPILDEDHFDIWKARMLIYLESIDVMLVDCVTDGPYIPMKANPDAATNGTTLVKSRRIKQNGMMKKRSLLHWTAKQETSSLEPSVYQLTKR